MVDARERDIGDLSVGDRETLDWTVTEEEIDGFAALSGDRNPLHMDAIHARKSGFQDRVAHGYLLGAKVSQLIGMRLPGRRCLLLDQSLSFPNPMFPGDTVRVALEVADIHTELRVVSLKARATVRRDEKDVTVGRGSVTCKLL